MEEAREGKLVPKMISGYLGGGGGGEQLFMNCVSLHELLNLPKFQFLHLKNKNLIPDSHGYKDDAG